MGHKGHYGEYTGNARHSRGHHHMVNSWEEEDVKRGRKLYHEGHKGHAEALFDDAHDSYNWHPGMDTHAEHHGMSRSSSPVKENQEEYLKKQWQDKPKPMPLEAPQEFMQTAPKRLFQSYSEEGNKGFPTKEYVQNKYEEFMGYGSKNPNAPGFGPSRKSSPMNKDKWIQEVTADIKKRGTEGVWTGDKFGGPTCPPGSKRYNLAKTFKKMAKK